MRIPLIWSYMKNQPQDSIRRSLEEQVISELGRSPDSNCTANHLRLGTEIHLKYTVIPSLLGVDKRKANELFNVHPGMSCTRNDLVPRFRSVSGQVSGLWSALHATCTVLF